MEAYSIESLRRLLADSRKGLIAIDGYHGTGKSTVAREVATRLRLPCVHLDDFLIRNQGAFLECLRYDQLSLALRQRPVIVEGLCMLAVLQKLAITADVFIYIRAAESPAAQIQGTAILSVRRKPMGTPLSREVAEYHRLFEPAQKADIVYVNAAISEGGRPMDPDRPDIDVALIQAKTKLAMTLAIGGMLSLVIGLVVLLFGVTGNDRTLFKMGMLEVSASGLGGVIMATSSAWAFFAYKTRPVFRRGHDVSEKYNPESGLVERHERTSSTEAAIQPRE